MFYTEDEEGAYRALVGAGVAVDAPIDLSPPVDFQGGTRDARFRLFRLQAGNSRRGG